MFPLVRTKFKFFCTNSFHAINLFMLCLALFFHELSACFNNSTACYCKTENLFVKTNSLNIYFLPSLRNSFYVTLIIKLASKFWILISELKSPYSLAKLLFFCSAVFWSRKLLFLIFRQFNLKKKAIVSSIWEYLNINVHSGASWDVDILDNPFMTRPNTNFFHVQRERQQQQSQSHPIHFFPSLARLFDSTLHL